MPSRSAATEVRGKPSMTAENQRLQEAREQKVPWRKWGPYLSERQWGTVREDYSETGNAWDYFSHDQARSRAYRWGEDGLAGISDDRQILCFALALWNGVDPIVKERVFGLTNSEGNHGEYAKAAPEDILVRLTLANRGPEAATVHVLPTLWFRNTWSWGEEAPKLGLRRLEGPRGVAVVGASHAELGERYLYCDGEPTLLFTENNTNAERIFGKPNASPWVKDAVDNYLVHGRKDAVNPAQLGTKVAAHYQVTVAAGQSADIRLRLAPAGLAALAPGPFARDFEAAFQARRTEADEFYASITPPAAGADGALVLRQALAGMLWSKQFYFYDVGAWLKEHGIDPYAAQGSRLRNARWSHMVNADVISMPDKWEYPWYAAWDLAFHTVALDLVDPDFAKNQLLLMLDHQYLHPSGQIPAYEWNFGDVNPPVHAWASWFVYSREKALRGQGDLEFLKSIFQKLLVNFTWWVNRKDPSGANVFEGGFLGLDNIGVFDRSAPLPTGGHLEQADGTAWMAFYCQTMLQIALELALYDPVRQEMAAKFYEHFLWIAAAMDRVGPHKDELWDEEDGFFYDVLRLPGDRAVRLKVRSLVGLLPLCAATVIEADLIARFPSVVERVERFLAHHPELVQAVAPLDRPGVAGRRMLALLDEAKLRRVLARMLDEEEFLSPFGIRSLSRYHRDQPYVLTVEGQEYRVDYEPAESSYGTFGGNSNWRGPIWAPINALLIRALLQLYAYYGAGFTVDCPTGSGRAMNLFEVSAEIARRLASLFVRDERGRRPVFGGAEKLQTDPHFRDHLLFYEYFHGDNGAGIGASHQTGWTGLVARLLQLYADTSGEQILEAGRQAPAKIAASLYPGHPGGPGP